MIYDQTDMGFLDERRSRTTALIYNKDESRVVLGHLLPLIFTVYRIAFGQEMKAKTIWWQAKQAKCMP